jgi:hypothetical protein
MRLHETANNLATDHGTANGNEGLTHLFSSDLAKAGG